MFVWLDQFFQEGIGPFVARANPQVYPFFAGALAGVSVIFLAHAVYLVWQMVSASFEIGFDFELLWIGVRELGFFAFVLLGQYVLILLAWLGLSTPLNLLPLLPAPSQGLTWIGSIPAVELYAALAVTLHGILTYFASTLLIGLVIGQLNPLLRLNFFVGARIGALLFVSALAFNAYVWESQRWPVGFVLVAETLIVGYGSIVLVNALFGPIDFLYITDRMRAFRLQFGVSALVAWAGLIYIWFWHDTPLVLASLFGTYYVLAVLDDIVAAFAGAMNPKKDVNHQFLSTGRWPLTLLLVFGITLLGAAGTFVPLVHNVNIDYAIWIEAGAAAAAYVLFRPLTDEARSPVYMQIAEHLEEQVLEKFRRTYRIPLEEQNESTAIERASEDTVSADQRIVVAANANVGQEVRQAATGSGSNEALRLFRFLRFRALTIFLAVLIVYHTVVSQVAIPSLGTVSILQIISYVASPLLGAASFIRALKLPAKITNLSLFLLILTLVIVLTTIGLSYIPEAYGNAVTNGADYGDLLASPSFLLISARKMLQEFSVYLLAGHIFYLLQVLLARWRLDSPKE